MKVLKTSLKVYFFVFVLVDPSIIDCILYTDILYLMVIKANKISKKTIRH